MFDLNESITGWRTRLANDENYAAADLDELESHLREEVDRLRESGLSGEEAFWVASRRLGNAESLSAEFAKVNGGRVWANRLLWLTEHQPALISAYLDEARPDVERLRIVAQTLAGQTLTGNGGGGGQSLVAARGAEAAALRKLTNNWRSLIEAHRGAMM